MLILSPHNSENQHITSKQTLNALKGEVVFRRIIGNRGQDTLLEDDLSSLFTHGPVGEIWYIPFDKVHFFSDTVIYIGKRICSTLKCEIKVI